MLHRNHCKWNENQPSSIQGYRCRSLTQTAPRVGWLFFGAVFTEQLDDGGVVFVCPYIDYAVQICRKTS
ncbi:hypothetical protein ES703_05727 [subsurface metagenome]